MRRRKHLSLSLSFSSSLMQETKKEWENARKEHHPTLLPSAAMNAVKKKNSPVYISRCECVFAR